MLEFRRSFILLLFATCAMQPALSAADWAPNVTAAATWNDNVTNSPTSADQLDSLQLSADVLSEHEYAIGRDDAVSLAAHFSGEWWPRYHSLLAGAVGGRAGWRHTFGTGTLAPTFSLEAGAHLVGARERGREGTGYRARAALRKRLNQQWRVAIAHERTDHAARQEVYDIEGAETSIELGFDASNVSRFTLSARYRDGGVVSYGTSLDPLSLGVPSISEPVTTFDRPMIASAYEARTWAGRVAYLRALDQSTAIIVGYEIRTTRAQPMRFSNQILSISVVTQF